MATRRSTESVLDAMVALRKELTKFNVELLEAGDLVPALEVTALLQDVKRLEERVHQLSGLPAGPAAPTAKRASSQGKATDSPDNFPQFFRRGDAIDKIALNAEKTDTYRQRLKRREFEQIRDALIPLLANRTHLFEAKTLVVRAGVPPYLVHFFIKLLEHQGLLRKLSRGRFQTARTLDEADVDQAWDRVVEEA